MFSLSLLKIKLITTLSMVFMGIFSHFVLASPLLLSSSTPLLQGELQRNLFHEGGSRTSLRFLPPLRCIQKRRRLLQNGQNIEEELTLFQSEQDHSHFSFIGEVIDQEVR